MPDPTHRFTTHLNLRRCDPLNYSPHLKNLPYLITCIGIVDICCRAGLGDSGFRFLRPKNSPNEERGEPRLVVLNL